MKALWGTLVTLRLESADSLEALPGNLRDAAPWGAISSRSWADADRFTRHLSCSHWMFLGEIPFRFPAPAHRAVCRSANERTPGAIPSHAPGFDSRGMDLAGRSHASSSVQSFGFIGYSPLEVAGIVILPGNTLSRIRRGRGRRARGSGAARFGAKCIQFALRGSEWLRTRRRLRIVSRNRHALCPPLHPTPV